MKDSTYIKLLKEIGVPESLWNTINKSNVESIINEDNQPDKFSANCTYHAIDKRTKKKVAFGSKYTYLRPAPLVRRFEEEDFRIDNDKNFLIVITPKSDPIEMEVSDFLEKYNEQINS